MRIRWIQGALLCFLSAPTVAADFCEGSKFVPLNQLLASPNQFLNKRVQTHAVLTTDSKEYSRIWFAEKSNFTVLTTADSESTVYSQTHDLLHRPPFNVDDDLFEKLRTMEGARYKKDKSKIRYYRQDVMACGRLIKEQGELRFAVDDMHIERSYLLPWKKPKSK